MQPLTNYALKGTMVPAAIVQITTEQKRVLKLEREIGKLPQVELPIRHFFITSPLGVTGGYAREMTILKGAALVGRVHKHPCINIISKGDISVTTDDGLKRIKAPHTFVSPAGTKRAGYAHEETLWTTFHLTGETDVDKIEDELGTVTHQEYLEYVEKLCLSQQ
jgi:quercetin dioxygenase-like cupin family protein